jgi:hypothetical protein
MSDIFETVLLLALPASGKSEVRRFFHFQTPEVCHKEFHMGQTVQLDDFPYVHMMRRIDDELARLGKERLFFTSSDKPFKDPIDWGTLTAMLNEDYSDLLHKKIAKPASAAVHLYTRIDAAAKKVGGPVRFGNLDKATQQEVVKPLEAEAREMLTKKHSDYTDLAGKTLVIEFARGGAHGSAMPLSKPFGYQYSLAVLSKAILEKAIILYIWVTPEESRRKNQARTNPNDPGSILHHGVPIDVMMNDYGCDDMEHLEHISDKPGTVIVNAPGKKFHLPIARFDNRVDKTTFLRADPKEWKSEDVKSIHDQLKAALDKVAVLKNIKV